MLNYKSYVTLCKLSSRHMSGARNAYIPFVWVQEGAGLSQELVDQVLGQLINPVSIAQGSIRFLAFAFCALFGVLFAVGRCGQQKKDKVRLGNLIALHSLVVINQLYNHANFN